MHCCGRIPGAYERRQRSPVSCRGISRAYRGPGRYYISSSYEWHERSSIRSDDSSAMLKDNNLCWGGGNPVEGGSATLPINLVSSPTTTSPTEDPQLRVLPNLGGDPEVATGSEPVFASHPRTQSPMVVHESPQYIVVDESPPPPPQPNTVGPFPPPPSPRPRHLAYIEQVQGIPHLIWPSCGGGSGGGHFSSEGVPAPVAARPTTPSCPAGVPSGPSVAGGAAGGGGGGSSPPRGGEGPSF